jgi:DNA-binding transcriptional regulator YiaG
MNGYHYLECGLDNIWLVNGYELHETPYGRGVSFVNAEQLDQAIAIALTEKPEHLSGKELRFLRIMLDMSQKRLGEFLGKEAQTVALWEKRKKIPTDVDYLVRHIYRQAAINNSESYVEMVSYLNQLDRVEHDQALQFAASDRGWEKAA